jgi:Flp pilus assembly protein TadD
MKKMLVVATLWLSAATAMAQNAAQMQLQNGTLDKAKTEIDKNIADPKTGAKAKTWFVRGQVYEAIANDGTGVYSKLDSMAALTAYESYKKALEVEPNGGKSGKEINEALVGQRLFSALLRQGAAKYQNKNLPDAVKLMSLAGQVNPKDTTAALYTGIAAQQSQNPALAEENYERYIANGGKDFQIIGALAGLYRNDKNVDKALAVLDKGLTILPGNKDLSAERVNLLISANRLDEAVSSMKMLVEKDPTNVQNVLNLGILYDNAGTRVGDQIRKLSETTRKSSQLTKSVADEKAAMEAVSGEITRLMAKIKKEPKNTEAKRQLAEAVKMQSERKTNYAQLEADLKADQAARAGVGDMTAQLAELTAKQTEQRNLSKQYYTKALAIDPANFDANFNMGVYFYNEAVEMKREVDRMDISEYKKRGAEVEGRVCGRFRQALPYFQKAKSVKDDDGVLNENLVNLQNVLKQFDEKKVACVAAE